MNESKLLPAERQTLVAFSAIPGIGRQTLQKLLNFTRKKRTSLETLWHASEKIWAEIGFTEKQREFATKFREVHSPQTYDELLASKNTQTLIFNESNYPQLLKEIADYPIVLFVKGPDSFWNRLPVAVVGTRRITPYGEFVTEKITRELVELGATIISGCMYGVDICAHQAAVEAEGRSVGVLGFGLDTFTPVKYQSFIEEFLEKGNTLVTEYAPEIQPSKGNFPARNRIVAGMSAAVVVTEASEGSGSLITAGLGAEYNRSVCAVPGPITSPFHVGVKELVNEGAKLVSSGAEVLEEIGESWKKEILQPKKVTEVSELISVGQAPLESPLQNVSLAASQQFADLLGLSQIEKDVFMYLAELPSSTEELSQKLHLKIEDLSVALSKLEIMGVLERWGPNWRCINKINT